MDTRRRSKQILILQIVIFVIIAIIITTISALTYDGGIIKEEAILSTDKNDPDYYLNRLNSDDMTMSCPIGCEYGDYGDEYFPNAKQVTVQSWDDMLLRTAAGRDSFFIAEGVDKEYIVTNSPTLYYFDEPIGTTDYSIGFANDINGSELCNQFDDFFAKFIESGKRDEIRSRWESVYDNAYEMRPLDVTFADDSKTLNIACLSYWIPYIYVSGGDGNFCGMLVDYFNAFCVEYGYKPNYLSITSLDSAVMGLDTGKYDVLLTGVVASEERSEAINISVPVCSENLYIFTRVTEVKGIDAKEYVGSNGFFNYILNSFEKNLITENRWILLAKGFLTTLFLSVCSLILGTILGAFIYFLDNRKNVFVASIGRLYINVFQRMPEVLLLLLLFYVVFGSADISAVLICILSFSLTFAANVAEILKSGVNAIPIGQTNAGLALGFTKAQTFIKIVLPQVIRNVLPVYRSQIIVLVLETSIAGYIAVEDLTKMSDIIRSNTYEPLIPMLISALIYFFITTIIGIVVIALEKKMDPDHRRRVPKWVENIAKK